MLDRLSLRARLVLAVVALGAAGLAVADVVTYASLRSFLFERIDRSLQELQFAAGPDLDRLCGSDRDRPLAGSSPGDYVELRTASGEVVCSRANTGFGEVAPSPPLLPTTLPATTRGSEGAARYATVRSQDGKERYRVRIATDQRGNTIVVVAKPLADVDATARRLLWIELLVTAVVLAALAALGLYVVRVGLRPLEAIGTTAAAIASGDLSQRVTRAEPRTEVGRLGISLNAMLSQIEGAFREKEASESKLRRFVADASHELRTPLAAVRAYAELFARGAQQRPDDLARSMQGISRESERMSALVDDLLLLARLDEGRPLEHEPVELERVVTEAVDAARAVEPGRPISSAIEPATVIGDRERLRQIVDNLLGNVRAHTPPRAPAKVSVRCHDGDAVIEVSDTGPGLEAENETRVFERFYRGDPSRARSSGGTGLGLSIVAAVTESHGGTVTAESGTGTGATFRITVPLATADESERPARA